MLFFSHCFNYHSAEISDQILISIAYPAIPLEEFTVEPLYVPLNRRILCTDKSCCKLPKQLELA